MEGVLFLRTRLRPFVELGYTLGSDPLSQGNDFIFDDPITFLSWERVHSRILDSNTPPSSSTVTPHCVVVLFSGPRVLPLLKWFYLKESFYSSFFKGEVLVPGVQDPPSEETS